MFTNLENLDSEKHKDLRFKPADDFRFAAGLASVPLGASEVVEAAKHFPVVFSTDGPLLPMALLSLKEGANAFIDSQGKWLAPYVPAHVRRYPFILGNTDRPDNYTVMFVSDAPHFTSGEGEGEPLYAADGQMEPTLNKAVEFLKAFQQETVATEKLLAQMTEAEVLTMQRIDITRTDGTSATVDGIRAVDRKKLVALRNAVLADWVREGLMELIYAHFSSLKNFGMLAARQGLATPAGAQEGEMPAELISWPPRKP